ncbi:acyl-ACP--UDP-N- acetylglucosamine O-acyltransferase [Leucobacter chinensis]|uniref:acyl-ACP--UDP-N- acetylglucosamine O-acyltransferase n=1 Tax=Leucobacter chinensis TaxID=2851010 RepID=UPI001C2179B6|nr:acyl-ACP--UDP-N- acetylglucosamine O-acyltransferase [Leucobacter chinensis]
MTGISPLAFIGDGVTLGADVTVGPYAVILGPCTIGDGVWIGPGAQIGAPPEISSLPQNAAWSGDLLHAGVVIGDRTVIREGAVVHQGSHRSTTIGSDCWVLNRAYLAHDVLVGDATTISAGVSIGGHCTIGSRANLGMNASVHQRRVIASGAMVGMGTPVTADVPPFAKAYGSPARVAGVNAVGLQRLGIIDEVAASLLSHYESQGTSLETTPSALEPLSVFVAEWREAKPTQPMKMKHQ